MKILDEKLEHRTMTHGLGFNNMLKITGRILQDEMQQ